MHVERELGQVKKHGRPSGSRNKKTSHLSQTETAHNPGVQKLPRMEDEPQKYIRNEEQTSALSNLLREILQHNRAEITRIARELGVAENTVYRWLSGNAVPRANYLKRLPDLLPDRRNDLLEVINQSFPGILETPHRIAEPGIDIYRRVLELVATIEDEAVRQWEVTQTIFDGILFHLDVDQRGLCVTYAELMPAHEDGIHSLREVAMRGNPPWPYTRESYIYLGSTTLAGNAIMLQRLQVWDRQELGGHQPVIVEEGESSACACPVMRGGCVAGVLVVSSAQIGFFNDAGIRQAIAEYARLFNLALNEQVFQPFGLVRLRMMPDLNWQRREIDLSFVARVLTYTVEYSLPRREAERRVILELEAEFETVGQSFALSYEHGAHKQGGRSSRP